MQKQEILTYLEELIKKISGPDEYASDMDLSDDLGLSSIDIMSVLVACEKKFSVKISAKDLRSVATPEDFAELIESKLQ